MVGRVYIDGIFLFIPRLAVSELAVMRKLRFRTSTLDV